MAKVIKTAPFPHWLTIGLAVAGMAIGGVSYFKASGQTTTTTVQGPGAANDGTTIQGPVTVGPGGAGVNNGTINNNNAVPADLNDKARRTLIEYALAAFLVRGETLQSRVMVADDPTAEQDSTNWNIEVMKYVQDKLGPAYEARLNSGAGITGFVSSAPTESRQKIHLSTLVRMNRLHEFLREKAEW